MNSKRIIVFGSLSQFTYYTLKNLLRTTFELKGIVLSAYPPSHNLSTDKQEPIFVSGHHAIVELARKVNIPVWFYSGDIDGLSAFLHTQPAEIFLLSCYPRILPSPVVELANEACINIHPSKLPKYRGADPIFWQLRLGETETGVSLHRVTEVLDSGDVLHFAPICYPIGARLDEIVSILIEGAINGLEELLKSPEENWSPKAQIEKPSSWQPIPCRDDFSIGCDVSAETAFNFVRAYSGMGLPIKVIQKSTTHLVEDAIFYEMNQFPSKKAKTGTISVQFSDGAVHFVPHRNM